MTSLFPPPVQDALDELPSICNSIGLDFNDADVLTLRGLMIATQGALPPQQEDDNFYEIKGIVCEKVLLPAQDINAPDFVELKEFWGTTAIIWVRSLSLRNGTNPLHRLTSPSIFTRMQLQLQSKLSLILVSFAKGRCGSFCMLTRRTVLMTSLEGTSNAVFAKNVHYKRTPFLK